MQVNVKDRKTQLIIGGVVLGLGVLIIGFLLKNSTIINTAYGLLIVSEIYAAISMTTGDGAEEMVEDMPSVGKKIIHEHEEIAERYKMGVGVEDFVEEICMSAQVLSNL